jgi:hypothetical protein
MQPLEDEDEEKEEDEDYDDMHDMGEEYDRWTKQAEAQKPAPFQSLPTALGDGLAFSRGGEATGDGSAATGGDGMPAADVVKPPWTRQQPSQDRGQRPARNPILKSLTQQATSGAARSTTPPGTLLSHAPRKPIPPPNPTRLVARKADPDRLPPSNLATGAQASGKRPRSLHELGARRDGHQQRFVPEARSMPDSEDGERDAGPELDYPEDRLGTMPYAELRDEPFDRPAAAAPPQNDGGGGGAAGERTVAARVEAARGDGPEQQELLFNAMTVDEWEEAGEWFVGQFAALVRRMGEVRREKRGAAREAEAAIAARNADVEEGVRETRAVLEGMKEQGKEILKRRGG